MSLPKLNVTIHETILPSTERVIKFRPFLVKEEKLLLTALEDTSQSSMMNAIKGIINNCVQEKIEVDKLPIFDIKDLNGIDDKMARGMAKKVYTAGKRADKSRNDVINEIRLALSGSNKLDEAVEKILNELESKS